MQASSQKNYVLGSPTATILSHFLAQGYLPPHFATMKGFKGKKNHVELHKGTNKRLQREGNHEEMNKGTNAWL